MSTKISENLLKGIVLRGARGVLSLGLKEIGAQVGVTPGAVAKWENDQAPIKDKIFEDLTKFFEGNGVSFDMSNPDKLVIEVNKKAVDMISENPKHPNYHTLNEIDVAHARSELDQLLNRYKTADLSSEDPIMKILDEIAQITGGTALTIQSNKKTTNSTHQDYDEDASKDSS